MKKRRELDALMKGSSRNGGGVAGGGGMSFGKDSSASLLIGNSQSSTSDEDDLEVTSNPQRARRNGSTVVGTKPHKYSSSRGQLCSPSFMCSVFIFTACFLLSIYLFWNLLAMQHKYEDLSSRFIKLESDVNTNVDALTKVTLAMQPIKDQIGNLTAQSNELLKSLAEVKEKLPTLQSKIDEVGQASLIQDSFDQFKSSLASNINTIETKLTALETKQKEKEVSVPNWKAEHESEMKNTEDLLQKLQTNLSAQLKSHETTLNGMKGILSSNMTFVEKQFDQVSKNFTYVQKQLDVVNKSLDDHEVKIEELSEAHELNKVELVTNEVPQDEQIEKTIEDGMYPSKTEKTDGNVKIESIDKSSEKDNQIQPGMIAETGNQSETSDLKDSNEAKPAAHSDEIAQTNQSESRDSISIENSPAREVINQGNQNNVLNVNGQSNGSVIVSGATPHSTSTNTTTSAAPNVESYALPIIRSQVDLLSQDQESSVNSNQVETNGDISAQLSKAHREP